MSITNTSTRPPCYRKDAIQIRDRVYDRVKETEVSVDEGVSTLRPAHE